MPVVRNSAHKTIILIALILAGEIIFFLPFVLARVFRPTLLKVLDITNFELGTYFSVYGVVAMISYFFGGALADRFPSRNLMSYSLWLTALGGLIMAIIPSHNILPILYGFWGFTTIFLFWAALIRATREWGGAGFQGRAFGLLEGGRGLAAALLATLTLFIFSKFTGGEAITSAELRNVSFQVVILVTSAITFLIGVLIWVAIPKGITKIEESEQPTVAKILKLVRMPTIWMQAFIIVCAYVGYKITDDYSLYANEVLGFNEVAAAGVGTMALWMRPLFAVLAGFLADRFDGSKVTIGCFLLMCIGGLFIYLGVLNHIAWLALTLLSTTLIGVYGIRGIYFALMEEASIPIVSTGTAVGIMSVVGFTPDVFMSPLMGFLLDTFPGAQGHQYVFLVLMGFSLVGLLVSILFVREVRKNRGS
ncbi:MAG TPA: MFS transporter [Fulvivirga sp.]|nr:MFS transporter [Fulvivirga sp.]